MDCTFVKLAQVNQHQASMEVVGLLAAQDLEKSLGIPGLNSFLDFKRLPDDELVLLTQEVCALIHKLFQAADGLGGCDQEISDKLSLILTNFSHLFRLHYS